MIHRLDVSFCTNSYGFCCNSIGNAVGSIVATINSDKGRWDRPISTRCGLMGHKIDECYKLHGYPPNY